MRFAYADPPYLGSAVKFYGEQAAEYDTVEGQVALIERLTEYDGWALSMSATNLHQLLPFVPPDTRILAWVKTWATWRPGRRCQYAWEPVLMQPLRSGKVGKDVLSVRDWMASPVQQRGFRGAKPPVFARWLFNAAGLDRDDEFIDLFPGSGAVSDAWTAWSNQGVLALRLGVEGQG